jgi:hypothetical protein
MTRNYSQIRSRSTVRTAIKRIGMTGVLEVMAEYCENQAELHADSQRRHYLQLKGVFEVSRDTVSNLSNRFDESEAARILPTCTRCGHVIYDAEYQLEVSGARHLNACPQLNWTPETARQQKGGTYGS